MIDIKSEQKMAEAAKKRQQERENNLRELMVWPFGKMLTMFKNWKAEYEGKADLRLKQQAEANIYISDYFYDGRWVVALMCHNSMIDYCRKGGAYDLDPEGHSFDETPERLILSMQELRKEEYLRLKKAEMEGRK